MQANGSKIVISIVLLISLALLAFFTLPLWAPGEVERLPVVLPVAAAGVAVYSLRQMLRPPPKSAPRRPPG